LDKSELVVSEPAMFAQLHSVMPEQSIACKTRRASLHLLEYM